MQELDSQASHKRRNETTWFQDGRIRYQKPSVLQEYSVGFATEPETSYDPVLTKSSKSEQRTRLSQSKDEGLLPPAPSSGEDPFALFSSVSLHYNENEIDDAPIMGSENTLYTSVAYTMTNRPDSEQRKNKNFLRK